MPYADPAKRRAYQKRYAKERGPRNAQHKEKSRQAYVRYRDWLFAEKAGRGCLRCGLTDPRCLDFHHRDPSTKSFPIAGSFKSRKKIGAEITKCDLLCANCHRIVHYEQNGVTWPNASSV